VFARYIPTQHDRLQQGVLFQRDVPLHKAHQTTQKIAEMGWEVLTHWLYSPDLATSDFCLSGPLKKITQRWN